MLNKFINQGNFKLLSQAIEDGQNVSVFGLNLGEKLALVEDSAFLFYVVEDSDNISLVYDTLLELGRKCEVLTENISPLTSEFIKPNKHLSVLQKLISKSIDTIILTPEVMAGFFPRQEFLFNLEIKKGSELNLSEFISKLTSMNYQRVELVSNEGEFSVRGDVIDIFPLNFQPTRIFLDYDCVDNIKLYNPITMLTNSDIDEVNIFTNKYINLDPKNINVLYEKEKLKKDEIFDTLNETKPNDYRLMYFGLKNYIHLFELVDDATIVFDGAKIIYDKLLDYINDYNHTITDLEYPLNVIAKNSKLEADEILKFNPNHTLIAFHYIQQANRLFKPQKVFSIKTLPSVSYVNYLDAFLIDVKNYEKQNYTVILCADNEENLIKLKNIMEKNNIHYNTAKSISMCLKNTVNVIQKSYPMDIILPEEKLAIISSNSLFGKKKKVIEKPVEFFDGELPKVGDFVVHNFHGVGRCLGVQTLKLSNSLRDYVVIEYKNNDKLYLPVENMDQVSKYLGSDKEPKLNKIGGVEFAKTKTKVKNSVKAIAYDLISLYRERMNLKGFVYPQDDEMQIKFENSFPFTETIDQLNAINDCKRDMESGKIMDRLVCGDVGYGKTEVALRIAFKTILSGKQVAFLCPTTILSEQHFNTAKSRMADFGVRVEVINRLKSNVEIEKIKKDISNGKIDLIIGTHKLLANDIDYKNLGLLILDEEQKFGVSDKDKIKNIKKHINVLTLSATPIPRTLNMSLIGVRDISIIETPPIERIASEVQVIEYSDDIIKRAIQQELSRNGQVLVIYNRVESIYNFANYLKSLIPEAMISVAHGQMSDIELEHEIFKLYSGQVQVLVATTLIENGVDLPNANTLIVINSDLLGLSQLYQLKGRIGRSNKTSYAYFTFDSRKILSENAYKRLQAIQEFSAMGSGFKIAMRDLEIRGAGSIFGTEQSGNIEKIGYNMYVQLLEESIKELSSEKVTYKSDIRVETNFSAYLSHNYVSSTAMRMKMYKEIATIDTAQKFEDFCNNTKSVYGDLPEEFLNLIKIAFIKNMCANISANKLIIRQKTIICFQTKDDLTKQIINITLDNYSKYIHFNFSDTPTIEISGIKENEMLDFLISYLQIVNTK